MPRAHRCQAIAPHSAAANLAKLDDHIYCRSTPRLSDNLLSVACQTLKVLDIAGTQGIDLQPIGIASEPLVSLGIHSARGDGIDRRKRPRTTSHFSRRPKHLHICDGLAGRH